MMEGIKGKSQGLEKNRPLVSVIIPVYNVDEYLDICLESVVKQTYSNLEILLMEGKSTDNSLDICVKWLKIDQRISLVSRKDGGLGPARNFGIDMSKGEYIFFVDSDDYLPLDAIELLVAEMKDNTIDMVAGGHCVVDENGNITEKFDLISRGCDREIAGKKQKERYIRRGIVAVWGKLYRADFWKRTGIRMPAGSAEDAAVFPSIVIMADKIVCIDRPTCYYRVRTDSLFNTVSGTFKIYKILDGYCQYLQENGLFEEYRNVLFYFTCVHLGGWAKRLKEAVASEEEYDTRVQKPFTDSIKKYFGEYPCADKRILGIGSYNLRWMCHKIHPFVKGDIHAAFTTTISQFYNQTAVNGKLVHPNSFRQTSLQDDQTKTVFRNLTHLDRDVKLIILDFLDDLQDIVLLKDGNVLTYSEPYLEAYKENIEVDHIVSCMSEEYFSMWKKSCNNFINCLEVLACDVALIQSRLCIRYLDKEFCEFSNQEEIHEKNKLIERFEEYFLSNIKRDVQVITIPEGLRYSDGQFRYGCSEEYLGGAGQLEFTRRIFDQFEV
ncbi:MAG: glycosyltransferase family 2 protein [Lachnospiraceae bacterium]|nr:glycosyltransferase family 2 protein [Lachnospiraceae bacterium]